MPSTKTLPSLTSAMEDYLEAIYHLEQESRIARVRDIASRLDVKMSSVSSALKTLSSRGLIRYDPHQYIVLTERGMEKAKEIVRRHEIIKSFLTRVLKVGENLAEDNACRLEHDLDPEVMERLVGFMEFVEMCPVDQSRWLEARSESCEECLPCLDEAIKKVQRRAKAQKAALADGMTLAKALVGSQVIIETIKAPAKLRKQISQAGLEEGAIAKIEKKQTDSGTVHLTIKGYHLSLREDEASRILVKPC
jgi:DtxR family Mn-dependent transcriptional regulator